MKKFLISIAAATILVGCWHQKTQEELEAEQSTRDYIRFLLRSTNEYVVMMNDRVRRENELIRQINSKRMETDLRYEEYPEILNMCIDTLWYTDDLDKIDGDKLNERRREVSDRCEYVKDYCNRYVNGL